MKGRVLNTLKVNYFMKQFNQVADLSEIRIILSKRMLETFSVIDENHFWGKAVLK